MKTRLVRLSLYRIDTSVFFVYIRAQAAPASTLLATAPKSRPKGPAL